MCFSATASFVAAGVTGSLGLLALSRTREPRDWPLAATPLLFAAQQALEGLLWLALPNGPAVPELTMGFLAFALGVWPAYAPLAVLAAETDPRRRRLIAPWTVIGAGVGGYLLWRLFSGPVTASAGMGHIVYSTDGGTADAVAAAYVAATCVPLLLSSARTVVALGVLVLIGCATAYVFYLQSFQSVWCFFAAAASVVIVGHFEIVRRQVPAPAGV